MKFVIDSELKSLFFKQGYVELEGLLTEKELVQLYMAVNQSFIKRSLEQKGKTFPDTYLGLLECGRDLYREDTLIQRYALKSKWLPIVKELSGEKQLRLGFDQWLISFPKEPKITKSMKEFMEAKNSLKSFSCLQNPVLGLAICLNSLENNVNVEEGCEVFPKQAGNAIFFSNKARFDLKLFEASQELQVLLIGFTPIKATYIHKPHNPITHILKQLGYNYGDRLLDRYHPIG